MLGATADNGYSPCFGNQLLWTRRRSPNRSVGEALSELTSQVQRIFARLAPGMGMEPHLYETDTLRGVYNGVTTSLVPLKKKKEKKKKVKK